MRVQRGNLTMTVTGTGTLVPATAKDILAEASGTVSQILVQKGDRVQAGQVVARLDNESQHLNLEAQKLDLQMRQKELANLEEGNKLETQRLDLELRRKELADLKQQLAGLVVFAPAAGQLIELLVQPGDQVNKGMVVARLGDPGHLEVVAPVNAAQVHDLAVGQEAEVFLPDFLSSVPGRVTKIARTPRGGDTGGALYDVTVEVTNPGALKPGLAARPTFITPAGRVPAVAEGKLADREPVEVKASQAGEVVRIYFAEGDLVPAGATFLELANDNLVSQIEAKELQIQQAELNLAAAEKDLAAQIEAKRIQVRQAELTLADREAELAKMAITSPISGEVTEVSVAVGDEVKVGTLIAKVIDYGRLEAVVPIDELDIARVSLGQEVQVTTDAFPDRKFSGRVVDIATEGTATSGVTSFDVRVALEEQEGLRPGMTITASILVASRSNVLLLPLEAVQETRGRTVVMVPGEDGQPRPVPVELGLADARFAEVLSGLTEGQEVLISIPATQVGSSNRGGMFFPGMPGFSAPGSFRPQGSSGGGPSSYGAPRGGGSR